MLVSVTLSTLMVPARLGRLKLLLCHHMYPEHWQLFRSGILSFSFYRNSVLEIDEVSFNLCFTSISCVNRRSCSRYVHKHLRCKRCSREQDFRVHVCRLYIKFASIGTPSVDDFTCTASLPI